jgi:hypothetical protein
MLSLRKRVFVSFSETALVQGHLQESQYQREGPNVTSPP